jgi:hypothetical protein|tara:strand:- start:1056 stop:1964 length:909 start_codon:yes stop_codon:yes gene_type:complete
MKQNNKLKYLLIIITILLICLIIYKLKYFENINNFENENENGKIAFLFLTYNNLKRAEIWDRFFDSKHSDKFTIYNHAKEPEKITDLLLKDKHISEHIETCWGCFGSVEANILMMKQALKDKQNKKFILVSDSCIPIVSFNTFYNEIMKDDKSIINIHYNNNPDRYDNIINPPFKKDEFIKHSAQGLIFNRNHTKLIVNSLLNYKDNWKNMDCIDEHYFGNILRVLDTNFNINYENIKIIFDIWEKDKLKSKEEIIINPKYYALFKSISNQVIDEIRDKKYLFIRKVDDDTEINIEYLLNQN